jgi:hypothetical protein
LKGLPPLTHTDSDTLFEKQSSIPKPEPCFFDKTGKQKGRARYHIDSFNIRKDRDKIRSRFYPGIAKAMAEQWG